MGNEAKLFVYGTLLQGEERNHHLEGCNLIEALDLPGKLYDTKMDYPVALFDGDCEGTVTGELYEICTDVDRKLREIDRVEGTELRLYRRKSLRYKDHVFYLYEAGEALRSALKKESRIPSGSWRRHGSIALNDPVRFALIFEGSQEKRYREFPPSNSPGLMFLRGEIPILVTASHATAHLRMNKLKIEERYTGAISVILHTLTGCHALYTHWASETDPNFYDDAPFKKKLEGIVKGFGIRLVLDIHGTTIEGGGDIYPGVGNEGEFLLGRDLYLKKLEESVKADGLTPGGLHVFPASRQMTITKFVSRRFGIPAMQIEIDSRNRHPESNPFRFKRLVGSLSRFVSQIRALV